MKKSASQITHAHDRFFKQAMANKQVAKEFFETKLPADLLASIDLNNLDMQSGSYVDDMRQESIADILYKTTIAGHEGYLYLIVDHQSTPDQLMPFRVLRYTCNIIAKYLSDHKTAKSIPMILPLVVYHGKTTWSYSNDINTLVDAPKELVDAYFLKPFSLIDLTSIDDDTLKQKAWFGAMALTLKHIFNANMSPHLVDIIQLFKKIDESGGQSFIEVTIRYILDRGELPNKQAFF